MATFLVVYDLNGPAQNYVGLEEAIKAITGNWWHHPDSTWIVAYDGAASELRDALKPFLEDEDDLLVAKMSGEGAWTGFSGSVSDWLMKNL